MPITLAFDVYGTLIDTHGVITELEKMIGDKACSFSHTWRDKQLEYSFRRGLMQRYEPFSICISNALDYTCEFHNIGLTDERKKLLLGHYRSLPAFDDVETGLDTLKAVDCRMFAFSNGTADAVNALLVNAQIRDYFLGVVSVDDIKSFKPNPAVYKHFLQESEADAGDSWLISSNPFDILGAISAGMNGAWLKRSEGAVFDPWGIEPTVIIESLGELEKALAN